MSDRVRVGAIGAGWWATSNHFPLLAQREDVELIGVCGLGPELGGIRDRFGFGMATDDVDELFAAGLDAVIVTTPHDLHYPMAVAALDRGLHVLCEKPMTLHADEAWDLVERTERAGTQVLVPYGWNYKPFTVEAKRMLDAGLLGEIQYVLCHMASPTRGLFAGVEPDHMLELWKSETRPQASTWSAPEHGGGYAHGQVTHSSALLFWLTGLRAATVAGRVAHAGAAVDLFDAAVVRFDPSDSGAAALGTLSGAATLADGDPYQIDLRIFGSEGVLMLDVERERLRLHRYDGDPVDIPIAPGSGEYECLIPPVRFIELITGASTENNSPPDVAARSVELIEALLASSAADGTEQKVHA